ncbi:FAD-binding domain-containing protein [Thauera sp. JM12B12]|uniref:cryptochrome/deoxyribodipyrimidine photo-lyase family protein n=1 Tax=Thauera sp. JM12B12 TaxID=3142262 RepID=UPI0031F46CF3
MGYGLVWFKRDFRLADHGALAAAARRGPVLCVAIVEPALWAQADAARQHYEFMLESARALHAEMQRLGGRLHLLVGEAVAVLDRLHAEAPLDALYSHEETGNGASYARDRAVAAWCRARGVRWHEVAQFGVVRRLDDRDRWQAAWEAHVAAPQAVLPEPAGVCFAALPAALQPGEGTSWPAPGAIVAARAPAAVALGLDAFQPPARQRGGRRAALAVLQDFLDVRSGQYRGGISSPLKAPTACSRLSPYLAWGCLSLREVVQATRARVAALPEGDRRRAGLSAFLSRLYWHCHFIQKLEREPALEFRNLHRGYDGLREDAWNPAHFDALVAGRTGWPLVDACVAMLRETGWINFRMRAMLVSVAAYPLWLHWREVGLWLARAFLDYEPGIHWSQLQMQSGTTGINTTRVYNPIKQARDHDPQGVFVRRWLPALRRVPDAWLFEPWRMPAEVAARHGLRLGEDIALPLVELERATREAKARVHALRAQPEVRAAKAAIVERHGSRKRPEGRRRKAAASAAAEAAQLDLGF